MDFFKGTAMFLTFLLEELRKTASYLAIVLIGIVIYLLTTGRIGFYLG